MRKEKLIPIAALILLLTIIVLGVFLFVGVLRPRRASLVIDGNLLALVFINGEQVGKTPYEYTGSPGEITLKMVPQSFEHPLVPFETKVTLAAGIRTVVRRTFGQTIESSGGEVVSFEKIGGEEAIISVVSSPDKAQVLIDEDAKGTTPIKIGRIYKDKHTLTLKLKGYEEKSFVIQPKKGYRLTAVVQLIKNASVKGVTSLIQEKIIEKVEILETPGGFLRVRSEPSTQGLEVARVNTGEKFQMEEKDLKTGWYKILLPEGKDGWISSQYATISAEKSS